MGGNSEQERVRRILDNQRAAEVASDYLAPLIYAVPERRIRPLRPTDNAKDYYFLTQQDMGRGLVNGAPKVVLSLQDLYLWRQEKRCQHIRLHEYDHGQVFSCIGSSFGESCVKGFVDIKDGSRPLDEPFFEDSHHQIRISVQVMNDSSAQVTEDMPQVDAFVNGKSGWQRADVEIVNIEGNLFSRHQGVLETNKLKDARVLVVGQGSIGSSITRQLAQASVGTFYIVDHDILAVHNISRHDCPIEHMGRKKVNAVADLIHSKNPYADVYTYDTEITLESVELLRELVRNVNLVIWGADTHDSRLIGNRICVKENKPLIMAGFRRRAYAGQVLRIYPWKTPCYQCYLMQSPGEIADREVSTPSGARIGAYTDRPVPIEPGLSTWIEPVSTMMSLLAIQELLNGKSHTLESLDEDLVAPYYLWINRRESGTPFAGLPPLGYEVDGLSILRWYGLPLQRHPRCPVCGDFIGTSSCHETSEERPALAM